MRNVFKSLLIKEVNTKGFLTISDMEAFFKQQSAILLDLSSVEWSTYRPEVLRWTRHVLGHYMWQYTYRLRSLDGRAYSDVVNFLKAHGVYKSVPDVQKAGISFPVSFRPPTNSRVKHYTRHFLYVRPDLPNKFLKRLMFLENVFQYSMSYRYMSTESRMLMILTFLRECYTIYMRLETVEGTRSVSKEPARLLGVFVCGWRTAVRERDKTIL